MTKCPLPYKRTQTSWWNLEVIIFNAKSKDESKKQVRTSEKEDVKRKKNILSTALTVSFKAFSQKQTSETLGSAHHIPLTLYDGHSQLSPMLIKDKGNPSIIHIKPYI